MKQKQSQKVVINIGEVKPKRKPAKRKPAPRKPKAPAPGGGGGGGGGAPPAGGMSMPSDFFARGPPTVILPNRGGPIVESPSQIQQLIKPIEQLLLKIDQRPAEDEERRPSMKTVRDYMAQYIESFSYPELAPDPQFLTSASSSSSKAAYPMLEVREQGTQTAKATAETGTQYIVEQGPQPLIKPANLDPLVDQVRPVSESKQEDLPIEEESSAKYLASELQQLRDEGKLTESFLKKFQVSRPVVVNGKSSTLIQIARGLGMKTSRFDYDLSKSAFVKKILDHIK